MNEGKNMTVPFEHYYYTLLTEYIQGYQHEIQTILGLLLSQFSISLHRVLENLEDTAMIIYYLCFISQSNLFPHRKSPKNRLH